MFHVTKVQNDENTLYRQIKTQQLDCERNQGNHSLVYRSAWTRETELLFCSMETRAQIPLFLTGCVYILCHNNAREVSTALWGRGSTVQVINGNSPGKQEAVVSPHLQVLIEFRVSLLFPHFSQQHWTSTDHSKGFQLAHPASSSPIHHINAKQELHFIQCWATSTLPITFFTWSLFKFCLIMNHSLLLQESLIINYFPPHLFRLFHCLVI